MFELEKIGYEWYYDFVMQCTDKIKEELIKHIENNITEKRKMHIYAVAEEAKKLAQRYGVDVEKAEFAALFHDLFRNVPEKNLNDYIKQLGLDECYLLNSNLAHSKIAAVIMERDYCIHDRDLINAVSYHTTGRANMSDLEKIIYLADAIEPNRSYPCVEKIREAAYQDLDQACLLSLEHSIDFIKSKDLYLDKDTIMAKDCLEKKIKKQKGEKE
ncbi:MAG: bis(5'-nucleosyl)-tetraphosphatase (symmetrical) YqeK [Eubacteriales bacterium]|nr:bis(5'-nucleosyl)-tetraphosphatase (symmetrical) YqeK [Eubacteriales bacterium]